jgi:predicted ATPase
VWLVELAPVTEPGEVPHAILNSLGIRESPVLGHSGTGQFGTFADPLERLMAALAQRGGLLILDNCEHIVGSAAEVADQILAGCPGVRVLATSREPLRIPGEALWPVPPLPVPPASASPSAGEAGGPVAGYASVRLLADRATAVKPNFLVDAANAADVARICRALDGVPLAIELAAARLRTLSAAQLAQRLDARFELLTGGSRTAVPRHQTLRAVVDWSWELLLEPERVLAQRLSIFPGGITLTAAEQVCQDPALPPEAVLPGIFGLVEKSFLTVTEDGEPRYRMLETIRAYCAERLAEAGEQDQVRRSFAAHFLRLAETADPMLRGAGQHTWMHRLTQEQDNIHAAVRWAVDRRDAALALRFGQALAWFWLLRGLRRESGAMARDILAISEPAGPAGAGEQGLDVVHARALCALTALNANWDLSGVRQPLADAQVLISREPGAGGDDGRAVRPLHPLVVVGLAMLAQYDQRDPDRALRLLAAHFDSADPWIRSGARLMHAFTSVHLGRLGDVARQCTEALAGFEALGDRWGMALALVCQSELVTLDGGYDQAIAALEQAVELAGELTDWEDTAQMHASLAKCHSRLGDYDAALADMTRADRAAREQGESESDLWITYVRAELAWLRGDIAEAGRIARRLDARIAAKDSPMIWPFRAQALTRAALADIRAGDVAAGCADLATALRLGRDSQERSAVAVVVDGLAAAALWTGRSGGGRSAAEQAVALLGAAHSIRGAFDHSSLDAPVVRDAARQTLRDDAFAAAYRRGRDLDYPDAVALAERAAAALAQAPVSQVRRR